MRLGGRGQAKSVPEGSVPFFQELEGPIDLLLVFGSKRCGVLPQDGEPFNHLIHDLIPALLGSLEASLRVVPVLAIVALPEALAGDSMFFTLEELETRRDPATKGSV